MKILRQEEGQTLVLTALCMTAMLGFLALAIDVGVLFHSKRSMQTAADAAAVSAAQDYMFNLSTTTAQAAGKGASSANGYTDGYERCHSHNQCSSDQRPEYGQQRICGSNRHSARRHRFHGNVRPGFNFSAARAVAGHRRTGCLYLADGSLGKRPRVKGNYDIEAPGCGIYVNSPDSNALKVTGNGGTVNAAFLDVVGNNSGNHTTQPTPDTLNAGVRSTPWGDLSGPSYPSGCKITSALTSITTANMATVQGSASNNVVCFTSAVTLGNGVVLPGAGDGVVYLFEKDVTIATGATVSLGSGTVSPSTGCTTNCTFSNEAWRHHGIGRIRHPEPELQFDFEYLCASKSELSVRRNCDSAAIYEQHGTADPIRQQQ